ncbi:oligosaccharide flippase family protein [Micromonospora sp. NPDC047548]|uniref:oligosaccharide flippase family protein n=1 Tax=Micromonospora sp. NPDC047548 TaxID=3155624 RepID=UPI0033ED6EA4
MSSRCAVRFERTERQVERVAGSTSRIRPGFRRAESVRAAAAPVGMPHAASGITWSMLGLLVVALSQWAVIVLLSRLGTPEMVGQYAFGLAVSAPIVLLASLALRTVQVTDTGRGFDFGDYLRLRVSGMLVALLLIGVVTAFVGSAHAIVVMLVGVAKALDAIGDIFFGLFQRYEQMRPIGISMMCNGLLTVVAMVCLLALTRSIGWAVVGSVIGSLAASIGYCGWAARPLRAAEPTDAAAAGAGMSKASSPHDRRAALRRMGRLAMVAAPLGLASGLVSLSGNLPRYFIEHILGAAALGIFAALAYIVLAANILFAAISQMLLPRLTRLHAAGDFTLFTKLTLRLVVGTLALGAVGVAVVIAVGPAVVRLVYGAPYAAHAEVLTLLTVAAVFSGAVFFLGTALSALRRFGNQLAASLVMVAVTAAAGYLLVPRFGLVGAAWSVVITIGGDCILKTLMLRRALAG